MNTAEVLDPHISKLASHVIEYMLNQRVGVSVAAFAIITTEAEAGTWCDLFEKVKSAVAMITTEHGGIRSMMAERLEAARKVPPTMLSRSAEAIARLEDEAIARAEEQEREEALEIKVVTLANGQRCLEFAT
jgi:hypothetical protein